jgi:hypothetical protein
MEVHGSRPNLGIIVYMIVMVISSIKNSPSRLHRPVYRTKEIWHLFCMMHISKPLRNQDIERQTTKQDRCSTEAEGMQTDRVKQKACQPAWTPSALARPNGDTSAGARSDGLVAESRCHLSAGSLPRGSLV